MVNDTSIIIGIVSIFILLGTFMPYWNDAYNTNYPDHDVDGLHTELTEDKSSIISISTIALSIGRMFTWTWGSFWWVLEIIFIIMRITLVFILYRQIRSGGG